MTEKTQKIARGMCVLGTAVLLSGAPVHAELQSGGTLLVPGTIMGAPVTAKAEAKSAAQVEAAQQAAKTQTSSLADLASADVLEITDAPLPTDIKSEAAPQVIAPVVQAPKAEEVKLVEVAAAPAAESAPATEEVRSVVPPVALGNGTVIGNPVYAKGDAKRAKPAPVVAAPAEVPMVAKVEAPAPVLAPAPVSAPAPEVAKVAEAAKPAAVVEAKPAVPAVKMVSLESELKRLAPAKYRLVYASNVDKSAKVPQATGKNWQESVNAVAQSAGLRIEDSNGLMFVSKSMTTSADYKAAGVSPAAPVKAEAATEVVVAKAEQPAVAAESAVPEPVVAAPEVALASADEPVAETADSAAVVAAASTDAVVENDEPGFFGRLFADIGSWFGGDESATSKVEANEAPVAVAQANAAPAAEPVVEQASAPVEAETTMVAATPKTEAVAAVEPAAGVVPVPASMPAPAAKVEQSIAAPVPSPDMVAYAGSNFKPRADDKPVAQETVWRAEQGQTLLQVIRAWSEKAGVQLYWDSKYDYPLQASVTLTGSYEHAVRSLLQGFENAAPQPVARLHRQGNSGNKVLIIRNRGNIYGVR